MANVDQPVWMKGAATDAMAFAFATAGAGRMLARSNVGDLLLALRRARAGDPERDPFAMTTDELEERVRNFAARHPEAASVSLQEANAAFALDAVRAVDRERSAARKLAWSNAGGQRLLHRSMSRPVRDSPPSRDGADVAASTRRRQVCATREQLERRPLGPPDPRRGRTTFALWKW